MIKSKITGNAYFWSIFTIIPLFGSIVFAHRILKRPYLNISDILILLVFVFLFYIVINFLKHIKHIIIQDTSLRYYSILRPFGKTIDLSACAGKIILQETGIQGSYNVVYLIDEKGITFFKIMGLHYKNFEDLKNGINLKTIRFNPSVSQYFRLLFFERLNIKEHSDSLKKISINTFKPIKYIVIIGIILFILRLLTRSIS